MTLTINVDGNISQIGPSKIFSMGSITLKNGEFSFGAHYIPQTTLFKNRKVLLTLAKNFDTSHKF